MVVFMHNIKKTIEVKMSACHNIAMLLKFINLFSFLKDSLHIMNSVTLRNSHI